MGKTRFMLQYSSCDGEALDEYVIQTKNITIARKEFSLMLEDSETPLKLFQNVKDKGWVEKDLEI